jgi:hypothetical protein
MSWQGNLNNPVPSHVDKTKENPYFKNTENKALDTRRDTDNRKNFSISLLDIDTCILDYLQNVVVLNVVDGGDAVKVPIIYGSPERWKASQVDGGIRDQQGKLQLPAIMFKRSSFSKNENNVTFNRYLTIPVITKFTEKNKYDRFSLLTNTTAAPVHQIHAVTMPDHVKIEYEFVIWTEYVEQMNSIVEKINFAADDYWGDPQRFKFRVSVNDYSHSIEVSGDKDRAVKTTFSLSVFGYLLPESFENRKETVAKALTYRKINILGETVDSERMQQITKNIDSNSKSNKSNPYYKIGEVLSHNKDSWDLPSLDLKPSNPVLDTESLEKIKLSYSTLIQQSNQNTSVDFLIWHAPPTSPNSPGEEGWMSYDGNYHYIYVGGRWRRQALADFI